VQGREEAPEAAVLAPEAPVVQAPEAPAVLVPVPAEVWDVPLPAATVEAQCVEVPDRSQVLNSSRSLRHERRILDVCGGPALPAALAYRGGSAPSKQRVVGQWLALDGWLSAAA
jgi:hypothetical protein